MVHVTMDYGAMMRQHSSNGRTRSRITSLGLRLGACCVLAAACVLLAGGYRPVIEPSSLVSRAAKADAPKLTQQMLSQKSSKQQSWMDAVAAASALREEEAQRVADARAALSAEEEKQKEVNVNTEKMLRGAEESKAEIESAADARYQRIKDAAIKQAAVEIERAKEAKEEAIQQADMKLKDTTSWGPSVGVYNDKFPDMNAPNGVAGMTPKKYDPFANLEPPKFQGARMWAWPPPLEGKGHAAPVAQDEHEDESQQAVDAADAKVKSLRRELARAQAQVEKAVKMTQHLAEDTSADAQAKPAVSDRDPPEFYEQYRPGMLGPFAVSKRVRADHPEGHKDCKLHDIDCDELWPMGKHTRDDLDKGPPTREGPLGDNLLGLSIGDDDVIVRTQDSGLVPKSEPYVDRFDHWPEKSKRNRDLLYGRARGVIANKVFGVGDQYVPYGKAEEEETNPNKGRNAIADLMFGSWQQGFNKPHERSVRRDVNMFNQPFRQHMSVADSKGHQVFQHRDVEPGPTVGEEDE